MFNLKNIQGLFKINYKNIFERISPKDNKTMMDKSNYNDILSGIIIVSISSILYIIISIVLANYIINKNIVVSGGVNLFGVNTTGSINIVNLLPLIVSLLTTLYLMINKDTAQTSVIYYVLLCIDLILTVVSVFGVITSLASMSVHFIYGLLLLILDLSIILGYLFMINGLLLFCMDNRSKWVDPNIKEEKCVIKLSSIDINDISLHANVVCKKCGYNITNHDLFCPNCGQKCE